MTASPEPRAGDRVVDGGQPGTLETCGECSGRGLLLRLDNVPVTAAPEPVVPDEAVVAAARAIWELCGYPPARFEEQQRSEPLMWTSRRAWVMSYAKTALTAAAPAIVAANPPKPISGSLEDPVRVVGEALHAFAWEGAEPAPEEADPETYAHAEVAVDALRARGMLANPPKPAADLRETLARADFEAAWSHVTNGGAPTWEQLSTERHTYYADRTAHLAAAVQAWADVQVAAARAEGAREELRAAARDTFKQTGFAWRPSWQNGAHLACEAQVAAWLEERANTTPTSRPSGHGTPEEETHG